MNFNGIDTEKPLPGHTDEQIFKLARQANRGVFFRTVAVVSVVLLGVVGWFSAEQYSKVKDAADSAKAATAVVRNQAVENCENSLRPGGVRFIVANGIRDQIAQSQAGDLEKFFPQIDPAQLEKLVARANEKRKDEIHALLSVDCQAIFPKP